MTETPDLAPENTNTETGQAVDNGQGINNAWYNSFEGEELGYIQNKGWNKEDGYKEMYKSYRNLEKLRGVPEERLIKLPDSDEGWDEVYKRLGKPEDIDGYKFDVPEDMKLDEDRVNWFNETAFNLNLNKKQHNDLVKAAYEYESNIIQNYEKQAEQERLSELDKLKDDWGSAYDERIELGKRAAKAFVKDDTLIDKVEDALGSNAAVIKLFAEIGQAISEDKLPTSEGREFGYSKEQALADIEQLKTEIKADHKRLDDFNNGRGGDVQKLARLRKIANGN